MSTINTEAQIEIRNLRLRTYIGIKDEEILNKQDILLNLSIRYDAAEAISNNLIDSAFNYRTVTKAIIELVENQKFLLLERLAHDVLATIMDHPQVLAAQACADKPHALRFSESVSITLQAERHDYDSNKRHVQTSP